jgi:hypothetical protein
MDTLKTLAEVLTACPNGGRVRAFDSDRIYTILAPPFKVIAGRDVVLEYEGRLFSGAALDEAVWCIVEAYPGPLSPQEIETEFRAIMERNNLGEKKL